MTDDSRDRLIRLEVEVTHLTQKLDELGEKVTEMHDVLLKARGFQWLMIGLIAAVGFVAGKVGGILTWLGLAK